jgi:hypothetical protein
MMLLYASSHHKEEKNLQLGKKLCICEGSTAEIRKPVVLINCHSHITYSATQPNTVGKTVPLLTCSRLVPGLILSQDNDRPS